MLSFSTHKVFRVEGDKKWVRTGIDGDGNCFFHAYAYSVDANHIRSLTVSERKRYVMKIKNYLADRITFQDTLHLIHPDAFDYFLTVIQTIIHPLTMPDLTTQPLLSLHSYIDLLYQKHPSLQKDKRFYDQMMPLLQQYHMSIQSYIRKDGTWMYDSLLSLFMTYMNINIVIISHDTGRPITHYPSRTCAHTIYMYHSHDHYESVGVYQNDIMMRVFENSSFP
jgi:hypothetical protein